MTPLQHAAFKGRTDVCQLLLENGADVNSNHHENGYSRRGPKSSTELVKDGGMDGRENRFSLKHLQDNRQMGSSRASHIRLQ